MTFKQDLSEAVKAEVEIKKYLTPRYAHVRGVGESLTNGKNKMKLERMAGDIRCKKDDGTIVRIEVKRDKSAARTGNLFLERWSDNGTRTGKQTVGWFCNTEAKYDYFAFMVVGQGTIFVKKDELRELVETVKPRVLDMTYNKTQMNRSDGYIVKINQVKQFCKSYRFVEGLYI